jgi:Domain of unknown function (DU1801)
MTRRSSNGGTASQAVNPAPFGLRRIERRWHSETVSELFRFPSAARRDPGVDAWFSRTDDALRWIAQPWFDEMRGCGADVRELLQDGHPTACVDDAAFGYVDAFSAHASVGFFFGAALDDPAGLLEGAGKRMRHVKLRWGRDLNAAALSELIAAAYRDMRLRLQTEGA